MDCGSGSLEFQKYGSSGRGKPPYFRGPPQRSQVGQFIEDILEACFLMRQLQRILNCALTVGVHFGSGTGQYLLEASEENVSLCGFLLDNKW